MSAGKGSPGSHSGFDFSVFALVEAFCPVFDRPTAVSSTKNH